MSVSITLFSRQLLKLHTDPVLHVLQAEVASIQEMEAARQDAIEEEMMMQVWAGCHDTFKQQRGYNEAI